MTSMYTFQYYGQCSNFRGIHKLFGNSNFKKNGVDGSVLYCTGRSAKVDTIGHFDISPDLYLK